MKIFKNTGQPSVPGAPEQFTGSTWRDGQAVGGLPDRLHVGTVTFAPGARTRWHTHPLGQVLVALSGVGRVQLAGEPVQALHPATAWRLSRASATGTARPPTRCSGTSPCRGHGSGRAGHLAGAGERGRLRATARLSAGAVPQLKT